MSSKKPTLSIIVTAHREGRTAHPTMRSIHEALKEFDQTYEVIISLDNSDAATLDYFEKYRELKNWTVYECSFSDASLNRNFAISKSSGEYVALLDGDDLISKNWFKEAFNTLQKSKERSVVHLQYSIVFGEQNIIFKKGTPLPKEEEAVIAVQANRWDATLVTQRSVLEEFPYQANTPGFGYEDWHFNCETLASGIKHTVAPHTVLFVRRRPGSNMANHRSQQAAMRYTELHDIDSLKKIEPGTFGPKGGAQQKSLLAKLKTGSKLVVGHELREYLRNYGFYRRGTASLKRLLKSSDDSAQIPQWLRETWVDANRLEKQIFPSQTVLKKAVQFHAEVYELGNIFLRMSQQMTSPPDYLVVVPFLVRGGADKVAIRYANSLAELQPKRQVAVLSTMPIESVWTKKLADNVDFIDLGNLAKGLDEQLQLDLMAKLVVQSKTKVIHVVNSRLGYRFLKRHRDLLDTLGVKQYVCAFCIDKDKEGRVGGYIHSDLPDVYDQCTAIFSENYRVIEELVEEYDFDPSKFSVHYQPAELPENARWKRGDRQAGAPLRVLWANRVAKQKRPDILRKIAQAVDPEKITIDVFGDIWNDTDPKILEGIESLNYRGKFDGFDSLPIEAYDVLLHTSEFDGMPNLLLESSGLGLPIVSADIGGISELLGKDSPLMTNDVESVDGFVAALEYARQNPDFLVEESQRLRQKIKDQHNERQYIDSLIHNSPGYLLDKAKNKAKS